MRRAARLTLASVFFLLALGFVVYANSGVAANRAQRIEYKVVAAARADHEKTLNALGADGWRLVTVREHVLYLLRENR